MVRWIALAALAATSLALQASAGIRPPYLTQVQPVYGVVIPGDSRLFTYRGDWVMAIFDYDRINGNASVRSLPYKVCRITGKTRECVKRVWRGRPDIWLTRVPADLGSRRFLDFTWDVAGKRRGAERVWVHE